MNITREQMQREHERAISQAVLLLIVFIFGTLVHVTLVFLLLWLWNSVRSEKQIKT